ncbi:hypothetical protein J2S19_000490 [Metabacillus malikii]|uniref:Uncharacterized protein n=1 Tax=Metabacillus malikii TaxID=1504265 RepID=A0ABT9ZAG1_9BACI|nr:hypothetical protein [Metabacillus malikii]
MKNFSKLFPNKNRLHNTDEELFDIVPEQKSSS